jgi:hypothetical protein
MVLKGSRIWECGLDLTGSGYDPVAGSYDSGDKPSGLYERQENCWPVYRLLASQEPLSSMLISAFIKSCKKCRFLHLYSYKNTQNITGLIWMYSIANGSLFYCWQGLWSHAPHRYSKLINFSSCLSCEPLKRIWYHPASQKIPRLLWHPKIHYTVYTRARHWSLSWVKLTQSTPISLRSILILYFMCA